MIIIRADHVRKCDRCDYKKVFLIFLFFGKHLSISGVAVDSYKD